MSDANRSQLSFIEESTWGTTPSGALQIMRYVSEDLTFNVDTIRSNEIRSDRQTPDTVRVAASAGGTVAIEMSYGTYDVPLQLALQSAGWSSIVTVGAATTISAAAADNSYSDSGSGFGSLVVGQWVKVTGFATAANNGFRKIVTKTTAKITVTGGTLVNESAGPSVTILMGAQIVNGVAERFLSIERAYTDLSNTFAALRGMEVNRFSLNAATGAILTGSFEFLGKSESSETATVGTSYTAATSTDVMNAVDNVVALLENAASQSAISVNFDLNNNLAPQSQIGSLSAIGIRSGSVQITGAMRQYFETATLYNKFIANTASGVAFIVQDSAGSAYVVELPKIKFTSGKRVGGGINTDLIAELAFEAVRHATEGVMIRIVRFA